MTDTVETAATDIKKDAENSTHSHLKELLAWLKAKFEAVGLDIKTEIEKL